LTASKKADALFAKIGDKGVMLCVYLIGLTAHTLLSLRMEMASVYPDEFGSAAYAVLFAGGGANGVLTQTGLGWLGAVIYTPVMLIIGNPFAQYKAMLIINGAVASFIPVIAYSAAKKFGVKKAWHRLTAAFAAGAYPAVFAHTKLIWSETSRFIFPWIIILIILTASDIKNRAAKHFFSGLLALAVTAAVFADEFMLALILAAVAAIVFARILFKKDVVFFSTFIPSVLLFGTVFRLITQRINEAMRGSPVIEYSEWGSLFREFGERVKNGGLFALPGVLAGHLYYFAAATWGLGVLGICLFAYSAAGYKQPEKRHKKTCEELGFEKLMIFSAFAVSALIFTGAASVIRCANTGGYYGILYVYGQMTDSVIPLILTMTVCYIVLRGLDLRRLLTATVALGAIFTAFFTLTSRDLLRAETLDIHYWVSAIVSLFPLRIGEKTGEVLTVNSLLLTVSAVFCVTALFIVFVCCSDKLRIRILSFSVAVISAYSLIYTAVFYLPYYSRDTKLVNKPVYEISDYVFDSADAPPLVAFGIPRETAALIKFLNKHSKVVVTYDTETIPENCFIILEKPYTPEDYMDAVFTPKSLMYEFIEENGTMLGETDSYGIWALGEKAVAYALSQG